MFKKFAEIFSTLILTFVLLIIIFVADKTIQEDSLLDRQHINMIQAAFNEIVPPSLDNPQDILDSNELLKEFLLELLSPVQETIVEIAGLFNDSTYLSNRLQFGENSINVEIKHELFDSFNFSLILLNNGFVRVNGMGFSSNIHSIESFLIQNKSL